MENWKCPDSAVKTVGLAGVGTMGRCMLERMISGGFRVNFYDVFPSAAEQAAEIGGVPAASPCELAKNSDIILLSLPGPAQINDVLFGDSGMIDALKSCHVVVDTSTVDPDSTKETAKRVSTTGAAYLDCPILGRPSAVGGWMMPAGGSREAIEYVKPVLLSFASKIIPTGENGSGNALKLLNQMMYSTINAVTAEVLAIADKVGVGKELFYETVAGSSAATVSGLFRETGKNIIDGNYDQPVFTVDLLIKDASLATKMAKEADAPSFIASGTQIFNELAHARGLGRKDVAALYEVFSSNYNI